MSVQISGDFATIGRFGQLEGIVLPGHEFSELVNHIFDNEAMGAQFPLADFFLSGGVHMDGLDTFLLLEELEDIIALRKLSPELNDKLLLIYNNVKYQVHASTTASITLS